MKNTFSTRVSMAGFMMAASVLTLIPVAEASGSECTASLPNQHPNPQIVTPGQDTCVFSCQAGDVIGVSITSFDSDIGTPHVYIDGKCGGAHSNCQATARECTHIEKTDQVDADGEGTCYGYIREQVSDGGQIHCWSAPPQNGSEAPPIPTFHDCDAESLSATSLCFEEGHRVCLENSALGFTGGVCTPSPWGGPGSDIEAHIYLRHGLVPEHGN